MPSYAVESKRHAMSTTGIVEPVMEWVEVNGKRRPGEVQERDADTGMPLWQVEVIYKSESWGREVTATAMVTVGAIDRPTPGEFERVTFTGLRVSVSTNKAGGLSERWSAEAIESGRRAASGPSGSAAA
ncbi:MAG TPA: hypothetical protein VES95_05345 [Dermatophilaceae bacterium]|nr:hypothetical protein [Dermatophilaceae bacterium]